MCSSTYFFFKRFKNNTNCSPSESAPGPERTFKLPKLILNKVLFQIFAAIDSFFFAPSVVVAVVAVYIPHIQHITIKVLEPVRYHLYHDR